MSTQRFETEVNKINTELQNNLNALQFELAPISQELSDQEFLAQLATGQAATASNSAAQFAQLEQELAIKNASGAGRFAGFNSGGLGNAIGSGIGSLFNRSFPVFDSVTSGGGLGSVFAGFEGAF